MVTGFFVGGLIKRYGCRAVHIAGSILTCVSLLISAFAPSFETLLVAQVFVGKSSIAQRCQAPFKH